MGRRTPINCRRSASRTARGFNHLITPVTDAPFSDGPLQGHCVQVAWDTPRDIALARYCAGFPIWPSSKGQSASKREIVLLKCQPSNGLSVVLENDTPTRAPRAPDGNKHPDWFTVGPIWPAIPEERHNRYSVPSDPQRSQRSRKPYMVRTSSGSLHCAQPHKTSWGQFGMRRGDTDSCVEAEVSVACPWCLLLKTADC